MLIFDRKKLLNAMLDYGLVDLCSDSFQCWVAKGAEAWSEFTGNCCAPLMLPAIGMQNREGVE